MRFFAILAFVMVEALLLSRLLEGFRIMQKVRRKTAPA